MKYDSICFLFYFIYYIVFYLTLPACTLTPPSLFCFQANPVFYRYVLLLSAGLIAIFGSAGVGLSGAGPLGCLTTARVVSHIRVALKMVIFQKS